jgi:hypothetical protein
LSAEREPVVTTAIAESAGAGVRALDSVPRHAAASPISSAPLPRGHLRWRSTEEEFGNEIAEMRREQNDMTLAASTPFFSDVERERRKVGREIADGRARLGLRGDTKRSGGTK